MATQFERICGPRGDVNELEYIAALHQTCPKQTRKTGTISHLDVLRFLKSKYGVTLTPEQSSELVVGLAGGRLPENVRDELAKQKIQEQKVKFSNQQSFVMHHVMSSMVGKNNNNNNNNGNNNINSSTATMKRDELSDSQHVRHNNNKKKRKGAGSTEILLKELMDLTALCN